MALIADDQVVVAAHVDPRSRRRRVRAPLVVLAGAGVGLTYLAIVDPNQAGHYPLCPLRALFGIDCPGCGMLRGTHDLLTGNVSGAIDNNILLIALVPLAVILWVRWFRQSWRGTSPALTREQFRRRNVLIVSTMVLILVFGVIRNLVPYLGSGIG